jgi:hypothetical protein
LRVQRRTNNRSRNTARYEAGASVRSPGDEAGRELRSRRHGDDEPCEPEAEPAHVVQINDEERQDEAVAERVREAAELQQPHVARQLRIE